MIGERKKISKFISMLVFGWCSYSFIQNACVFRMIHKWRLDSCWIRSLLVITWLFPRLVEAKRSHVKHIALQIPYQKTGCIREKCGRRNFCIRFRIFAIFGWRKTLHNRLREIERVQGHCSDLVGIICFSRVTFVRKVSWKVLHSNFLHHFSSFNTILFLFP